MPLLKLSEKDTIALRFKLHDRVSCKCGGAWTTGVVVNKFYRQHSFPPGYCAAYQVRLETGQLIFSPLDDDSMIRAAADGIPEGATTPADQAAYAEAIAEDEFPLLPITSASTLAAIKQLATGPRDVFIASYPKSGTTWLQAIVFELASLGTDVELDHISNFTPFLEADRTWTPDGEIAEPAASHQAALGWRGFNTHLLHRHLPAGEKMRVLYVIRDAADACASMWHHFSHMAPADGGFEGDLAAFHEQWLAGKIAFGTWRAHVGGWLLAAQSDPRVLLLSYEAMKDDAAASVRRVAAHLAVDLTDEQLAAVVERTSFASMKANAARYHPTSVEWLDKGDGFSFIRKGTVGDAAECLTPAQLAACREAADGDDARAMAIRAWQIDAARNGFK